MYNWNQFWNTQKTYGSRWKSGDRSFGRPDYLIATPLEQCRFVMTKLDANKRSFPVDMWGNSVRSSQYEALSHHYATQFWLEGQGEYFDGYSIVLPDEPNPVLLDGHEYHVVGGVYENCVNWHGRDCTLSTEFIADRIALNYPLMWFTPNRKGMCWAGLNATPIIGGASNSKKISSFDLMIPITSCLARDKVTADFDDGVDFLVPLPRNADQVINKWFEKQEAA